MPTINRSAAIATITCEAAPIIASALANLRHPAALRFTYTTTSVIVTATNAERLNDAEGALAVAFAAHLWGFTAITEDTPDRNRLSFQAPDSLLHSCAYAAPCLFCNGPVGGTSYRGCCSARCAHFEHDRD